MDVLREHSDTQDLDLMVHWIVLILGQAGSDNAVKPLVRYRDHSSDSLIEECALHAFSHLEETGARTLMEWFDRGEPNGSERLSVYTVLEDVAEHGDRELREDTVEFRKERVPIEHKNSGIENRREEVLYALAGLGVGNFVLEVLEDTPENPETRSIRRIVRGEDDDSDLRMHRISWQEFADKKMP